MAPQLQQAIGFLQLSNLELSNYVENVIEKNPLLERNDVLEKNLTKKSFESEHTYSPYSAKISSFRKKQFK